MEQIILETSRLMIRPFAKDDLQSIQGILNQVFGNTISHAGATMVPGRRPLENEGG